ncbi:MAG: DUF3530 family protein [Saccharospirillum sp.]
MNGRPLAWLFWLLTVTLPGQASELTAAHQRQLDALARQLEQQALPRDTVLSLQADDAPFLALYQRQRSDSPQGGILILHDSGHTPDWPVHLQQARAFLPEAGWSTLAIALPWPSRADEASIDQSLARIAAGVRRLNEDGLFNLVFLGYGEGAYWAARYMAERLNPQDEVGYALLMVNARDARGTLPDYLGQIDRPTLDLVMQREQADRFWAQERLASVRRQGRDNYTQILDPDIAGASQGPHPNRATRRLWGWLRTHAAGREAVASTP